MSINMACYYHPTTVAIIDDNKSFLDNILLALDANIRTRSFVEPAKAIEYLRKHSLASFDKYLRTLKDSECMEEFNPNNIEHGYVDVDIFNIHKEMYNPERFATTIVVVVDYTMPEMNGIELCRELKDLPLKFILITGDATIGQAVAAFNEGLIHRFIPKGTDDFVNKVQNSIYALQKQQFEECSDIIIKNLSADRATGLEDPLLTNFIKEIFVQNNIIEYYLLNKSRCYLMANMAGDISCLVIKSEEEMIEYTNVAIDNYGDEKIIQALQSREKVLFLYTEKQHIDVTVDNWEKHLFPATKIICNAPYYYSLINMEGCIFNKKIVSYKEFLAAI